MHRRQQSTAEKNLVPPMRICESLNKLPYMVALSKFLLLWEKIPIDMPDCAAKHIKHLIVLFSNPSFIYYFFCQYTVPCTLMSSTDTVLLNSFTNPQHTC